MQPSKTASRFDLGVEPERLSERPFIPPLLLFGCSFWLGSYVAGLVPFEWVGSLALGAALLVVLCLVVIVLRLRRSGGVLILILCSAFCLGCLTLGLAIHGVHQARDSWQELSGSQMEFRVTEDVSEGDYGYSTYAEAWVSGDAFHWLPGHSIKVKLFLDSANVTYGNEFAARAIFTRPRDSAVASYDRKQVVLGCSLSDIVQLESSRLGALSGSRSSFSAFIDGLADRYRLDQSSTAVLKALVIGERKQLFEQSVYQDVKICGLAHMVAVSGAHLVIVLGLVNSGLKAFSASRRVCAAVQLVFLFIYLVMVGFPISCLRASAMAAVGLVSFTVHRRSYALSSLGVAMVVLIAIDSSAAFSLSFALSAFSTLGIVLFTPLIAAWLPAVGGRARSLLAEPLVMTLSALLLTFPLSISAFSQFSLIAPLANILAVPLVSACCIFGVLGFVAMQVPCIGVLFALVANGFCFMFAQVVGMLSEAPFAAVPVSLPLWLMVSVCLLTVSLLWCAWPVKAPIRAGGVLCLACVLCLSCGTYCNATRTSVNMLDVGQGDAILFKSKGATLLVDTGNQTAKLLSALAGQGVHHLDGIVITHPDDDHCGSLPALRGVVSCDRVFVAKGLKSIGTDKAIALIDEAAALVGPSNVGELSVGDTLHVGALSLRCISPNVLEDEGGNQDSIVLLMTSDLDLDGVYEWSGLFGGDAESETLQDLNDSGAIGKVDILKVSHHGAKAAMTHELAEEFCPRLALVSVGSSNRYGHPASQTIEYLQGQGAEVLRTDIQGTVVCSLESTEISVYCMR